PRGEPISARTARDRGLFVTRAQFFHRGHAAFIEAMRAEHEEIVVVIATANVSHRPRDPATAGERMEIVKPYLLEVAPRHHLFPAPFLDFDAVNFAELDLLAPPFGTVWSNNPAVRALAESAHKRLRSIPMLPELSSTTLRDRIRKNQDWRALMPHAC